MSSNSWDELDYLIGWSGLDARGIQCLFDLTDEEVWDVWEGDYKDQPVELFCEILRQYI